MCSMRLKMAATKGFSFLIFLMVSQTTSVFSQRLEVSVIDRSSGYFLKPFYPLRNNVSVEEWPFVASVGAHQVKAQFGPSFEAFAEISQKTLHQAISNHSSLLNFHRINGHEVSAHLVTETIISSRPRLQVLFHARPAAQDRFPSDKSTGYTKATDASARFLSANLCLVLFAFKDNEVFSSTCTIIDADTVCMSDIAIPLRWWSDRYAQTVDVFYSVYNQDGNSPCSSENQLKRYGRPSSWNDQRTFLAAVTLTHGQMNYQELKEDQYILIYVPTASFYPGSKFRVSVKLQAESDLEVFVIRVKVRHGIKVVGAEAKNGSRWSINVELNARRQSAMVTSYVINKETYTKTDKVQDIYDWVFEVDGNLSGNDQGRLSFSIEYEMTSKRKEIYGPIENKAIARVQIQQDNTFAIVPVVKTTELINTAVLTGEKQTYPLSIFSVSHAGKILDITSQTTCHSGDEDVLQATESCRYVFLSGKESKGSSSVSVIAKFGRHTRFLFFRVWIPELPLDISVSDNRLNLVSLWKVPLYGVFARRSATDSSLLMLDERGHRKEDLSLSCQLRYQSAVVEVYTRFVMSDITQNPYMLHRKAQFRVTDFVRDRLHIVDPSVVQLRGNIVDGIKPGRTDIQVLSVFGGSLGIQEIKVSSDRVNIQKLEVNTVSGLDLTVGAKTDFPGAIAARISKENRMSRKNQEAYLDIVIRFDDDSLLPLFALPPNDYSLEADEVNTTVVRLSPTFGADAPVISAVGSGSGDLIRVRFMSSSACPAPKTRTLASGHAYVNIAVTNDATQNDAGHFGYPNRGKVHSEGLWADGGFETSLEEGKKSRGRYGKNKAKSPGSQHEISSLPGDEEIPRIEAQKQPISEIQTMTSLEMAMYVLLAIFCFAIVVFTANCMLFVARHRRKRKEKETKDPVSEVQDWVWIGRETLERNAVITTCSQTLMPDADFNGNLSPESACLAPPLSVGGGSGNRSGQCSNRSSQASTYQGSECSIHITANQIPDNNGNTLDGDAGPPPIPPVRCHLPLPKYLSEDGITKEQFVTKNCSQTKVKEDEAAIEENGGLLHSATDSEPLVEPMVVPVNARKANGGLLLVSGYGPRSTLSREERLRQLEEAVASGSDIEWDYDELGMTYEELMEYFDNLKESSA